MTLAWNIGGMVLLSKDENNTKVSRWRQKKRSFFQEVKEACLLAGCGAELRGLDFMLSLQNRWDIREEVKMMQSSFLKEDVTLLLKDITGLVEPLPAKEREQRIQNGVHYSEMLPLEYAPSAGYLQEYEDALTRFSGITAAAVKKVCEKIVAVKGSEFVLVSFARAGIPVGILLKRYFKMRFGLDIPHYGISIIRGKGIDDQAIRYILDRHSADAVQFVDGWTGKGAIYREMQKEIKRYPGISGSLAVLADPAGITSFCGTHQDFLIASSCLNAAVCGLISRTFYRRDLIGPGDFHGAAYYAELAKEDRTYEFINTILAATETSEELAEQEQAVMLDGLAEAAAIAAHFGVKDINLIKPGIGETTRVLLRRVPDIVLIGESAEEKYVSHLEALAHEKGVPTRRYPLKRYKACGIIKTLNPDV